MKKCPFCNSSDVGYSYGTHPDGRELSFIACGGCGARGPVRTYGSIYDDDESEASWNARAIDAALRPFLEA
ncbi:hypothetical protein DJ031_06825 [bacterium endosymbiont of Escarpia laminata]|nr:MAG: hypothetical protein DJ031_06825 [bacterium endosymbiont of Escarpia laminata]